MQQTKPEWLKIRPPTSEAYALIKEKVSTTQLHTVCQEAHCPNMAECWSEGTATFMVLGDTCTRGCRFCAVKTARNPEPLDKEEPQKLAESVQSMKLSYVVLTSVDRDDLEDQGSNHFAACITAIKKADAKIYVECLIPDFQGRKDLIDTVIAAKPEVLAHNIETVKELQSKVRDPRANYAQSLSVLKYMKEKNPKLYTKSSIIVGFGETKEQVKECMQDLRNVGVDFLTIGQYLQPSKNHFQLHEYVSPEQFKAYEILGKELGFKYVASGPFVRSSYRAGELFTKALLDAKKSTF